MSISTPYCLHPYNFTHWTGHETLKWVTGRGRAYQITTRHATASLEWERIIWFRKLNNCVSLLDSQPSGQRPGPPLVWWSTGGLRMSFRMCEWAWSVLCWAGLEPSRWEFFHSSVLLANCRAERNKGKCPIILGKPKIRMSFWDEILSFSPVPMMHTDPVWVSGMFRNTL